jgi:hypothetical protein
MMTDTFYDMLENSIILTGNKPVTNFDPKYTAEEICNQIARGAVAIREVRKEE